MSARLVKLQLAVVVWSFGWTYVVGHFGIFAFDQSIMFDGGWRILSGQVPFKDFIMAFGPLSFLVQALFFKLFGVNWTSMVVAAAFVGAAAALSVMRTVSLLFGRQRFWLIGLSGFLVGTSFQAIFGTLWIEQVAFFFCLLGIQVLCESVHAGGPRRYLWLAVAGALSVLAFLSKQNVGALTVALLGLATVLVALPDPWRVVASLGAFLIGVAFAAGVFALWLVLFSDPHLFIRHALEVPSELGRSRVSLKTMLFLPRLLATRDTTQWCYAVALAAAFEALFLFVWSPDFRRTLVASPMYRLAVGLTLGVPFVRSLFQMTTMNQDANVLFLSGLALVLGIGLFDLIPTDSNTPRRWIPVLAGAIGPFLIVEMMIVGWNRSVHDVFPSHAADLSERLHVPRLENVRWISPTLAAPGPGAPELDPRDIDAVCAYLASLKKTFLVIGDSSYLYGVNGVVPPQPLLYFQTDHYFTKMDIPRIDEWVLSSLKSRDVQVIVWEKVSSGNNSLSLPNVDKWIVETFRAGPTFGNFEIWLRRLSRDPS